MHRRTTWSGYAAATLALALVCAGGFAQAQAVEQGEWIDLFDGETLFGWTVVDDCEWEVEDGVLRADRGTGGWLASSGQFTDFELEVELRLRGDRSTGVVVRSPMDGHASENGAAVVYLEQPRRSSRAWREVRVVALGDSVTATVDGEAVEGLETSNRAGHVGLLFHGERPRLEVRSVRLRPLNLASIFNGENLDGWNIIPGRQSEFSVEDGVMRIVDGNGQIETADVYRNFLLQIDVISHGDHLNSGVFYRGPVGVFWRGYEAQIRNEWAGDDRTRPVDYGTGGIYGVQPARKVVSSDYEWFTMTVLCNGNQQSVWVDGYLVADYVDTRPISESADGKRGYVPGPGTIHLQGHDPATDLSFKNIHIQVYP